MSTKLGRISLVYKQPSYLGQFTHGARLTRLMQFRSPTRSILNILRVSSVLIGTVFFVLNSLSAFSQCERASNLPPVSYFGQDLKMQEISRDRYPDQPVLVGLWSSYCRSCEAQLRDMERIQRASTPDKLLVIALSYKHNRTRTAREVLNSRDLEMTIAHDPKGRALKSFGYHQDLPRVLLFDPDGELIFGSCVYDERVLSALISKINLALETSS